MLTEGQNQRDSRPLSAIQVDYQSPKTPWKEFKNNAFLLAKGVELSGTGAGRGSSPGALSMVTVVLAVPDMGVSGGSFSTADVVMSTEATSGVLSSPVAVLRDQKEPSGEAVPGKAVVFWDCVLVADADGDHPEAGTDEARTLKSFALEELEVGKIRLDSVTGPDRNLISSSEEVLSHGVSGPLFTRVGISERGKL